MRYTAYASRNTRYVPRYTLPAVRCTLFLIALLLSRVLYKSTLFMQNKPNLPAFPRTLKMNITPAITVNYIYEPRTTSYELITKNKPNQTQDGKMGTATYLGGIKVIQPYFFQLRQSNQTRLKYKERLRVAIRLLKRKKCDDCVRWALSCLLYVVAF